MQTLGLGGPSGRLSGYEPPRWPWKRGIPLGLIALLLLLFAVPALKGTPIAPQLIRIKVARRIREDCELNRSFVVLEYVYSAFKFEYSDWPDPTKAPRPEDCPRIPPTIYVGYTSYQVAARSGNDRGCRQTNVNLDHPSFTVSTMAHEFGHHRFGDTGLPPWMTILDGLYDCRNWLIIKWRSPGSTARLKALTSDSH